MGSNAGFFTKKFFRVCHDLEQQAFNFAVVNPERVYNP